MLLNLILSFGSYLLFCFLLFRLAKKANLENAWLAFVPIVQIFQYLKLAKVPGWWFFGLLIPFVNFGVIVWLCIRLARNFGEKKGFGILLLLPPVSFWAMWKLGKKDTTPPLSADDQESVDEIRKALEGGYSAEEIKNEALKLGISGTKVDLLFSLANQKLKLAKTTKTWLIVVLAILEIPLFFGMIFLIAFSIITPLLFSGGENFKGFVTFSTNDSEPVIEENIETEKPEGTEDFLTDETEYGEEIILEGFEDELVNEGENIEDNEDLVQDLSLEEEVVSEEVADEDMTQLEEAESDTEEILEFENEQSDGEIMEDEIEIAPTTAEVDETTTEQDELTPQVQSRPRVKRK